METRVMKFRGREFTVIKGLTHPEYSFDTFEKEEAALRDKYWNIGPGDVVLDVGASYGSYTLTAAAMGAYVFAYEPEPSVFSDLVANINRNDWRDRIWPVNMAMGRDRTDVDMRQYAKHWPQHTISGAYPSTTIDGGLPKGTAPTWIKIDVEGLEEDVIAGGAMTLALHKPKLLIECHDFIDPGISERIKVKLPQYVFEDMCREPGSDVVNLYGVPR